MPKRLLLLFEYSAAIAALVLCSGGPLTVILTGGYSQGEPSSESPDFAIMRQLFLLIYVVFAVLLGLRWQKVLYVLQRSPWVLLLLMLPPVSILWSVDPAITFQRSIAIIGSSLVGIYLASRFTLKQQLHLLALTCGVIVGLSLLYAIGLPKYGVMGGVHAGAWRGIYTHKNTLGKIMVLCAATFLLLLRSDQRYRLWGGLGLASSVALILLSTSKSALINLVLVVVVIAAAQLLRLHYKLMVVALTAIMVSLGSVIWWVGNNLEDVLVSLGKDITLTGRTDIWKFSLARIQERPLLGYGYQAFWQGWGSEGEDAWLQEGWRVTHAHNGFVDLSLELGLVGLVCFMAVFWITIARRLGGIRLHAGPEHILPILVMMYLVMANITESAMMKRNDLLWVLFVTTSLSVPMASDGQRRSSYNPELYARLPLKSPGIPVAGRRR